MKIFTVVYKLPYNPNIFIWDYDYVPEKNMEIEINKIIYRVSHKLFKYDEGVLEIILMK